MHPTPTESGAPQRELVFGTFVLDRDGWSVTVAGRLVPLTASEFVLLHALALHAGRVMDRGAIERALAQAPLASHNARSRGSSRNVDVLVSRVRRKLLRAGYDGICTMRFVGYGFVPAG